MVPDAHEVIDTGSAEGDQVRVELPVSDSVAQGSKTDRLAVAQEAIAEGIRREADSAAKKQARFREKHPDYVEREKERMKARRARIRGSPSE